MSDPLLPQIGARLRRGLRHHLPGAPGVPGAIERTQLEPRHPPAPAVDPAEVQLRHGKVGAAREVALVMEPH